MQVWLAPRAPGDRLRPRRLAAVVVRPLNFTLRGDFCAAPFYSSQLP
jgi:hypothetical protein